LTNAEKSASLIKQLLRFAQKDVNVLEDVNINKLISDNLNYLKDFLGPNVEVSLNLSDLELIIGADADQVKHVLANLSDNARAAIVSDGKVNISTKVVDVLDNQYNFFKDLNKGKYVEITFSDTGCGIDTEAQEHVFEPFYTTKDVGEGVGMGLATVFSIVRQHKGDIKLYSEENVGSTFKIYFPVLHIYEKKTLEPVKLELQGKTILVVEDNESINKLARLILEEAGYETLSALTGQEAIEVFDANKDIIDLMLIDVVTPGFSGAEVFEQVSKIKPVSVVFCSGYEKEHLEITYDIKIPGEILKKPYTEKALLSRIDAAL
jgi:CheY-like chemotaxis protein